jgi:hypothetical protein
MFKYEGSNLKIKKAVEISNDQELFENLYECIEDAENLDMTNASGNHIAQSMREFIKENDISINVYYPKWKWSKAIGYFSVNNPTTININGYKLNRSIASFIGNFYHELTHMVSAHDNFYSYDHGSNNPTGKQNTAPYFVGRNAKCLVSINYEEKKEIEIEVHTPWYKRLLNFIWRA